jgi:hypothetical protein
MMFILLYINITHINITHINITRKQDHNIPESASEEVKGKIKGERVKFVSPFSSGCLN